MAFILGIYERLLKAIRAFDGRLLRHLMGGEFSLARRHIDLAFLFPLGLGIFGDLMFFTRIVPLPSLIRSHPELIYGLFFGLILASVVVLLRELPGFSVGDSGWLVSGIALGLIIVNLVPLDTPETWWFVFACGAGAICAMILPGVSGSFILLVLKKYAYIFDGIGRLDMGIIVPFGLGAVCGLLLFTRALVWLLRQYYRRTLTVITGLLVGSLWMIWPFQERLYTDIRGKSQLIASSPIWPREMDVTVLSAAALTLAGIAAVLWLHAIAKSRNTAV